MAKKNIVSLVRIRDLIHKATEAGLVKWEATGLPVPFNVYGNETLSGFKAVIGSVTIETIVIQKDPTNPRPGSQSERKNFAFGLRINEDGKEVVYTTDPEVISGDPRAEIVRDVDQKAGFAWFCEEVQHLTEERSLVSTLEGKLLKLFHPA